jgi:pimeloyl-ACP methyl ester carboxylesterase
MTMIEGTVVDWPLPVGARVEKGQTVVVIESEKNEVEIEATASGFFRHVYVEPGETVPCGTLLGALTDAPDEPFDAEAFRRENDLAEPQVPAPAAARAPRPARGTSAPAPAGRRTPVAPAARALARTLGVEADEIPGSGPGGRVTKQDVEAWAAQRESLVEASGGVRLEVPTQGEGAPLLLLPGFGSDVSSFSLQAGFLATRHRVLGVNPRGVGVSDAPALDVYDVATAADDAAAVCSEPAHWVGASLGAAVALEAALRHPQRVRSLVLITPFVEATPRLRAVTDAWRRVARDASAETLACMLLPWLFSERFLGDEAALGRTLRGLSSSVARVPAETLERAAAGLRAWSGTRADMLSEIHAPTLVLAAGGDLLTPGSEAMARAMPNARSVVVPEAGHALAIEAPDAVNPAIAAHLASVSG